MEDTIMNKNYMTPTIEIIQIRTQSMIAVSGLSVSGTTDKESELLSREFDYDEEDEEEW